MTVSNPPEPLSHLLLEQYHLGELSEERRRQVQARLAASPEDRAVLDSIVRDQSALPPLPDFVKLRSIPVPPAEVVPLRPSRAARGWAWAAVPALAVAAALLLMRASPRELPPARRTLKGGDLALRVVSERGGDAVGFSPEESLKVLVTCPPVLSGTLAVAVFQGGERYEPLPEAPALACGNQVPWPGAFRLDGTADAHVCVADAAELERVEGATDLGDQSVCLTLRRR